MGASEICTATVTKVYNQNGINLVDVKRDDNGVEIQEVSVLSLVAGPQYGMVYVPPKDQQVLVAILDVETQLAVCLGCLYNATSPAPFKVDTSNSKMYLKYGNGWTITLDSQSGKEMLEIKTSKNDVLTVDQSKRVTTIKSADGQTKMEMDFSKGSINVEAMKEIKMTVAKNNSVEISTSGVKISGTTSVKAEASTVSLNGRAKGEITAGLVQVKGNMQTQIG